MTVLYPQAHDSYSTIEDRKIIAVLGKIHHFHLTLEIRVTSRDLISWNTGSSPFI